MNLEIVLGQMSIVDCASLLKGGLSTLTTNDWRVAKLTSAINILLKRRADLWFILPYYQSVRIII